MALTNLVRVNTDGTVDLTGNPFAGANNPVLALALQPDGKLVAGGQFTVMNTTPRSFVARVNTDGSVDGSFDPGTGANGAVRAVAVQSDGKILIGGDFTVVAGVARNHVARLNANGSLDLSFDPLVGPDNTVNAITLTAAGQAVIGGTFASVNGTPRGRLARLMTGGTNDPAFLALDSGMDDYVSAIALQADGRLVVGGGFTVVNGLARYRVARLNADGTLDSTINFGTGADSPVNAALVQTFDDRIVLGGSFTNFNGTAEDHLVRVNGRDNSGSGVLAFSAATYSVAESGPTVTITVNRLVGLAGSLTGVFTNLGGTAVQGVDYLLPITNLTFVGGQNTTNLVLQIPDTAGTNVNRVATLALITASANATNTAQLTIVDNDSLLNFTLAGYSVVENAGVATISVARLGGTANAYSVQYATSNGTALAGIDYTNTTGVLNWADGDASVKTFTVGIIDNLVTNSARSLNLSLFGATNQTVGAAVTLSGQTNATLAIIDNEQGAGSITFSAASYSISEAGTNLLITVVRSNGILGSVSVTYGTPERHRAGGRELHQCGRGLHLGQRRRQRAYLQRGHRG